MLPCDALLKGSALVFAPRRGTTLDQFVVKAKHRFVVDVQEDYHPDVNAQHKQVCQKLII